MVSRLSLLGIAAACVALGPAIAADRSSTQGARYDPDEKVCENITMVGSRLAVKRVCATRAQWAEKRRRDRDMIDKAQMSPCVLQRTDGHGKMSC
jgi:hypothetical protein